MTRGLLTMTTLLSMTMLLSVSLALPVDHSGFLQRKEDAHNPKAEYMMNCQRQDDCFFTIPEGRVQEDKLLKNWLQAGQGTYVVKDKLDRNDRLWTDGVAPCVALGAIYNAGDQGKVFVAHVDLAVTLKNNLDEEEHAAAVGANVIAKVLTEFGQGATPADIMIWTKLGFGAVDPDLELAVIKAAVAKGIPEANIRSIPHPTTGGCEALYCSRKTCKGLKNIKMGISDISNEFILENKKKIEDIPDLKRKYVYRTLLSGTKLVAEEPLDSLTIGLEKWAFPSTVGIGDVDLLSDDTDISVILGNLDY